MATKSDIYCDICASQDRTNLAIKWCPECEEALCNDCVKHHSVSKLSRNHEAIDVAYQQKLPDFISNIQLSCEEHKDKFQLFCPEHDIPCCAQCISAWHTNCKGLLSIVEIVKNSKTSSALHAVEEILNVIRKNIKIIVNYRQQNDDNLHSQFQNIRDDVKKIRQKLVTHLETLENELLEEIMSKELHIKEETKNVIKAMEDHDLKIQAYQENISAIKEYGTDTQTFFGTREIAKFAETEEQFINASFEDGTLNGSKVEFQLDEHIERCLNIKTLGTILHKDMTESGVKPVQTKGLAAQIGTVTTRTKSLADIKVLLKNRFRVLSGKSEITITGCDVFPDGKLVFADCNNNKRIVLHSCDGTFLLEVKISILAFDVSVFHEESVFVSSFSSNCFEIVNTSTSGKKITTKYSTSDICSGITYANGKVLASIDKKGIISYDIVDKTATTIKEESTMCTESYVAFFNQKVYFTNRIDNSVTCLKPNRDVDWKLIDTSLIITPYSISTDQYGNVFVSSLHCNSIVVISPDGKHCRKILDEKDGIRRACALCYDKIRDKLIVANWSGNVFVFDMV